MNRSVRIASGLAFAVFALAVHPSAREDSACADAASVQAVGLGTPGTAGVPQLVMGGAPIPHFPFRFRVENARPSSFGYLSFSPNEAPALLPGFGVVFHPGTPLSWKIFGVDDEGSSMPLLSAAFVPGNLCGASFVAQAAVFDPLAAGGASFTRAVRVTIGAGGPGGLDTPQPTSLATDPSLLPGALAMADLDADGDLDLAVVHEMVNPTGVDTDVTVLLNLGDGQFAPGVPYTAGFRPTAVAIADTNGDLVSDLVVGNQNSEDVSVLLGIGNGTFAPQERYSAGDVVGLDVHDMNGDGVLDVVTANYFSPAGGPFNGEVAVLLGVGDGSFGAPLTFVAPINLESVAVDDVDGDGAPDVVACGFGPEAYVFLGLGDGTLGPAQSLPFAQLGGQALTFGEDVLIEDLDQDGVVDVIVAAFEQQSVGSYVAVLLGQGGGTFGTATRYPVLLFPFGSAALDVGNLNGDLFPDLVLASPGNGDGASALFGTGGGTFSQAHVLSYGVPTQAIGLGDLNGDLVDDLVVTSRTAGSPSTAWVTLNRLLAP